MGHSFTNSKRILVTERPGWVISYMFIIKSQYVRKLISSVSLYNPQEISLSLTMYPHSLHSYSVMETMEHDVLGYISDGGLETWSRLGLGLET